MRHAASQYGHVDVDCVMPPVSMVTLSGLCHAAGQYGHVEVDCVMPPVSMVTSRVHAASQYGHVTCVCRQYRYDGHVDGRSGLCMPWSRPIRHVEVTVSQVIVQAGS